MLRNCQRKVDEERFTKTYSSFLSPKESCTKQKYQLFSDLSDCQLQQVPDAIFMLMQNTSLVSCNLSHNVINKIPAKLAIKWTLLTGEEIISYIQEKGKWNIRFSKSGCWLTGFLPQSAVTFEIGSEGLTPRFSFTSFEWTPDSPNQFEPF